MPQKVLFLNPPGKRIYIRDYYCSKVSKAFYLPQPLDLLMQTGYFAERGYHVSVIDAIADKISFQETVKQVVDINPDLIIAQTGSVSFEEDRLFFEKVKGFLPEKRILSSGDLFLEDPRYFLEMYEWLDGIIINWFGDGSLQYFEGNYDSAEGLVFKNNGSIRFNDKKSNKRNVSMPRPRHELFLEKPYRYSYVTHYPMATVLTNYGCTFPCTFCIMPQLGFSSRVPEEVIDELSYLKKMGVRYIYFSDQTFYALKEPTDRILDFMIDSDLRIDWCCFSRVDQTSESQLLKMKKAGCNVVMYGVEFADNKMLQKYRKGYTVEQIKEAFAVAKRLGLKRMGTFLIGVPGQSEASIRKTIDFAIEIEADYASFNVAVPRANTSFRAEALEKKLITEENKVMDQSGSFITMGTDVLDRDQIYSLKKEAYRRFYFRPKYLARRLRNLGTWDELKTHVLEGSEILKGLFH